MKTLLIVLIALGLNACSVDPEPAPPPNVAPTKPADGDNYAGKDSIYDTQFKALHDAKQLGAKMNEDAARLDEQIDPENNPPRD